MPLVGFHTGLAAVARDVPVWDAFPRRCLATGALFNGNTKKWMLVPAVFRGARVAYKNSHTVKVAGNASDWLEGRPKAHISHYRFDARAYDGLKSKRAVYAGNDTDLNWAARFYDRVLDSIDASASPPRLTAAFQKKVQCRAACPAIDALKYISQ